MAKAQGKKTAAAGKSAAKKVAARVKSAVKAVAKKTAPKKPAAAPKPATKKAPAKPAPKPVKKAAATVKKAAAKVVKKVAKTAPKVVAKAKAVAKPVKAEAKPVKAAVKPVKVAAKPAPKPAPKPGPAKPAAKPAPKPAAAKSAPAAKTPAISKPVAVLPAKPAAPVAPTAPEPEKKRGRRARTRITSSGAPAAAWLSTEKPRPASFIPAPPRAEAPSAIAAPPASSDRLLRPEDTTNLIAVRTVPVRIDIEQGAGRFYVMAYPSHEVTLKVGEGIEWDFRYIGGADVTADEVVIEFERPSPFPQHVYRTRKPGGARPHRQLSGGALPAAAGKHIQYSVKAMNAFKSEMASTKISVVITS